MVVVWLGLVWLRYGVECDVGLTTWIVWMWMWIWIWGVYTNMKNEDMILSCYRVRLGLSVFELL